MASSSNVVSFHCCTGCSINIDANNSNVCLVCTKCLSCCHCVKKRYGNWEDGIGDVFDRSMEARADKRTDKKIRKQAVTLANLVTSGGGDNVITTQPSTMLPPNLFGGSVGESFPFNPTAPPVSRSRSSLLDPFSPIELAPVHMGQSSFLPAPLEPSLIPIGIWRSAEGPTKKKRTSTRSSRSQGRRGVVSEEPEYESPRSDF